MKSSEVRGVDDEGGNAKYLEAAALLSHLQKLESKLLKESDKSKSSTFGHRKAPNLSLCRIPDPKVNPSSRRCNLPIVAMMAYTEQCISAQLLRESVGLSGIGAPVEVLVVSEKDAITSAIILPLERLDLTTDDTLVITDKNESLIGANSYQQQKQQPKSLMSGGVVPVAPNPRLVIIVGTKSSRVISIEFTIQSKSMQLLRRNCYAGGKNLPYFEPLPRDRLSPNQEDLPRTTADRSRWIRRNKGARKDKVTTVPFCPTGGVTSLVPYSISATWSTQQSGTDDNESNLASSSSVRDKGNTYVWIGYGDGSGIKLFHAGFFPSVIQKYGDLFLNNKNKVSSLEEVLGQPLIKWYAHLPTVRSVAPPFDTTMGKDDNSIYSMVVVPIPKYHPTPLAAATNCVTPFPTSWNDTYQAGMMGRGIDTGTKDNCRDDEMINKKKHSDDNINGIYAHDDSDYEAIVYCKNDFDHSFPTLAFYTSEDQYPGRFQEDLQELIYGSPPIEQGIKKDPGTSRKPISTIVGGIFGVLGGSGGNHSEEDGVKNDDNNEINLTRKGSIGTVEDNWDPALPFPTINRTPIGLYAGVEIHDHPRQITHCTIDPNGNLAALTDTLGRVSLIDLTTKQIIRMFKGYREACCHWLQVPRIGTLLGPRLFLLIHSRQRCVVEVWQMTHGSRYAIIFVQFRVLLHQPALLSFRLSRKYSSYHLNLCEG